MAEKEGRKIAHVIPSPEFAGWGRRPAAAQPEQERLDRAMLDGDCCRRLQCCLCKYLEALGVLLLLRRRGPLSQLTLGFHLPSLCLVQEGYVEHAT